MSLGPLVAAQRGVIALIKEELSSGRRAKFSYDFLLRYAREKHSFFKLALEHFRHTHVDFRGEVLCAHGDLSIYLTADARFSPSVLYSERQAKICLPIHYCFMLDVFTGCVLQRMDDETVDTIELDVYADVLLDGFDSSVKALIKHGASLWLAEPERQSAQTVYTSALSSLSVLYHEIGHFAAGHTRHYQLRSVQRESQGAGSTEFFHAEDDAATTEAGGVARVIAEITADTYAFIRLYLYSEPCDVLATSSVLPFDHFVAPVQASLIPLYLANLRRRQRRTAEDSQTSTPSLSHPPLQVREQNIWNTLYVCLSPAAQQWYDVRLTELERTHWVQALRKAESAGGYALQKHHAVVDCSFVTAYCKVRRDFHAARLRSYDGFDLDTAHALFAAKSNCFGLQDPLPDTSLPLIDPIARLIDGLWAHMSDGVSFDFAQSAPRHWFREYSDLRAEELHPPNEHSDHEDWVIVGNSSGLGKLIRDPVFKIIDDWMSTIHRYRMDDEVGVKIRMAMLKKNAADVRILGRTSELFYFLD